MTWNINDRGFLPPQDPIETIVTQNPNYASLEATLENLSVTLPSLVEERRVREELVAQLRNVAGKYDELWAIHNGDAWAERVMLLYSYFASAYLYAKHENPATRIPKEIAIPLNSIAKRVGRPPILSYASYCLTNWRRIDPNKPIELGNIELLQNFSQEAKRDEDWFILVHVDIEAKAADAVNAIDHSKYIFTEDGFDNFSLYRMFERIIKSLQGMNATLARMPEQCSPDVYYRLVRPYIFGFKGVEYEGVGNLTLRGETGAQSSIVPMLLIALGIKHKESLLTVHLDDMRNYMPPKHRAFLENLAERMTNNSLREAVLNKVPGYREAYNECVNQLMIFRSMHFEYAVNYIAKKVDNPEGTGGTPYIPWLQQLKDETWAHLLP
jgi:indoleamine 2,3-dioxygenase